MPLKLNNIISTLARPHWNVSVQIVATLPNNDQAITALNVTLIWAYTAVVACFSEWDGSTDQL
jgi:hypothetical protein